MKKISAVVLITILMAGIFKDGFIYLSFKINQSQIIKILCVNKGKPEMKCNGKCHLKTQLEENEKEKKESPYSVPSENKQVIVWLIETTDSSDQLKNNKSNSISIEDHFIPHGDYIDRLFRPPQV